MTEARTVDPAFAELPLHAMADAALERARARGAAHADVRCASARRAEVHARDARFDGARDDTERGIGVRVWCEGAWGFAASDVLTPASAAQAADRAIEASRVARLLAPADDEPAAEPVYRGAAWLSAYEVDPFEVPQRDTFEVIAGWSETLLRHRAVDHVYAKVKSARETTFYADLAGSSIVQQRVRLYPQLTAVALDAGGGFETLRTVGPPSARGWEYLLGSGWDWDDELAQLPELLAEKRRAPAVVPGTYDLVIEPSNLWLTVHETVGHATELDRVLGYELAYAGTSFARAEDLGTLRYGSPAMHVTGDRTTPHGLATVGWDDEGVAAQEWEIVRAGVLAGFQTDRRTARALGARSNGCAFAESAHHPAVQRMANVSLQPAPGGPGVAELIARAEHGIYVVGDRGFSIDMRRERFQFTAQRCYAIERGRLAGAVRGVAYTGTTLAFWNALEAVGGPQTYGLFGADYCGKSQPLQIAAAGHGAPAALFRGVRVLDVGREGR